MTKNTASSAFTIKHFADVIIISLSVCHCHSLPPSQIFADKAGPAIRVEPLTRLHSNGRLRALPANLRLDRR